MFTCSIESEGSVLWSGWSHCYSSCRCWRWRTHHQSTALWSSLHRHWPSDCRSFAIAQHIWPPPATEYIHQWDYIHFNQWQIRQKTYACITVLRPCVPWEAQPCPGESQQYHWESHQCCRCPSPTLVTSTCENVPSLLGALSAPEG